MSSKESDESQEMAIDDSTPHETYLILHTDDSATGSIDNTSSHLTSNSIANGSQGFVKIEQVEKGNASTGEEDIESIQCIDNTIVVPSDSNIYSKLLAEHGSRIIFYNAVPQSSIGQDSIEDNQTIQSDSTGEHQDGDFTTNQPLEKKTCTKTTSRSTSGERMFVCPTEGCGRHFTSSGHLKYHQSTHSGLKPFKCPQSGCEKVFAWPAHLKYHLKTHSGDRPYKCEVEGCGKSFYVLQRLNVHLRIHTGERPFKCEIDTCKKSFSTAGNLKNHMRIHTGEKPYICPFVTCGKSFTEHSSLRKHKLRHTGEKPYTCEICGKSFSQSGSKNAHEKRHLLDKPPRCKKTQMSLTLKDDVEQEQSMDSSDQEPSLTFTNEKSNTTDHMVLAQPIIAKEVSIETTPVTEELISSQHSELPQTNTCVVSLAETVVAQQVLLQSMLDGATVIPVAQNESSDDLAVVDHVLEHQDVEQIMQSVVSQHIIQLPVGGDISSEQGTINFITQAANSQESEEELKTPAQGAVIVQVEENVES